MRRSFNSILCLAASGLLAGAAVARAADVEIDSNTFGGIEARSLGPASMGGRIAAIDAVGQDPLIVYVGAAGGGVWKSTDGGTTFKPVFDEHAQSIGAITINQKDPKNVWVGTGESWTRNSTSVGDGIYKTTDGGETWQRMGLENTERIARVQVSSANADIRSGQGSVKGNYDDAKSTATVRDIAYVAGGVALAAGATMFVLSSSSDAPTASVGMVPTGDGFAAAVAGHF